MALKLYFDNRPEAFKTPQVRVIYVTICVGLCVCVCMCVCA